MSDHIIESNEAGFDQDVLAADQPVLVDFWAPWCGPCKSLAPVLESVSREYADRLRVVKINVDDNQALVPRYGVRGIPTLMLFQNGAARATRVGALSQAELSAFLDQNL